MIDWSELLERQLRERERTDSDSHTEPDKNTYHPSSLSRCKRQATIQKLGLDEHSINTLWNFYLGTRQHEDLQEWFEDVYPGVEFEKELSYSVEHSPEEYPYETTLHFTGHCDVYDPFGKTIYDFKSRKSWKGFDGASESHKDQLTTYMKMAGVDTGQLVYIIKSAPWDDSKDIVKTWPEDSLYEFDAERWEKIKHRAKAIHDGLDEFQHEHDRLPESIDEVPFEKCGCWLCNSED